MIKYSPEEQDTFKLTLKSSVLSLALVLIEDNEFSTELDPSYLYSNLESHGAPLKLSSDVARFSLFNCSS